MISVVGLSTEFSRIFEKPKDSEEWDRKTLVKVTLRMLRRKTVLSGLCKKTVSPYPVACL